MPINRPGCLSSGGSNLYFNRTCLGASAGLYQARDRHLLYCRAPARRQGERAPVDRRGPALAPAAPRYNMYV